MFQQLLMHPRRILWGELVLLIGFLGGVIFSFYQAIDSLSYSLPLPQVISLAKEAGNMYGINPSLILAVIRQESNFRPWAYGKAGEIGLMQVSRHVAKEWSKLFKKSLVYPTDLYQVSLNVQIGSWYLARGLTEFSSSPHAVVLALAYYNAGPTRARTWYQELSGKLPDLIPISSTKSYIKNVLRYQQEYEELLRRSSY